MGDRSLCPFVGVDQPRVISVKTVYIIWRAIVQVLNVLTYATVDGYSDQHDFSMFKKLNFQESIDFGGLRIKRIPDTSLVIIDMFPFESPSCSAHTSFACWCAAGSHYPPTIHAKPFFFNLSLFATLSVAMVKYFVCVSLCL